MAVWDLVIRGGTIIDGTGGEPFEGDIAIAGGRIGRVGAVQEKGREEIDAKGHLVTPGFVDIHTHYDGQATWDSRLTPSSLHGVTTAVMGNCGVGFAPCRKEDQTRLVRLMEGVEDIPEVVMTEGLPWTWEHFPDFLAALEARPHDIDFAAQFPHAAVRVYVMGERGADREPATPEDIQAMAALARDGVLAGALGFSTSRTLNHRTSDGSPTPTLTAGEDELTGIAQGLQEAGRGVLQVVSDFTDPEEEFAMLERIVRRSGRPLSFTLVQSAMAPQGWRTLLGAIEKANAQGLPIKGQVCGRPVGLLLGLTLSLNPFTGHPTYKAMADLPIEDRVRRLRDPGVRDTLLAEEPASRDPFMKAVLRNFAGMYPLMDPPDYEPRAEDSVGARAKAQGRSPEAVALDMMLEDEGRGILYFPFLNYADTSLEPSLAMMRHKDTVLGLGDGGAHLGMICDASFTTYMLTHWTRDRTRGEKLDLPWVVRALAREPAQAVGLLDRGLLKPGYRGDVNIIDHPALALRRPTVIHDLPAGGKRLMQKAEGYKATVVAGEITYRDGEPTGALPGKLVRGPQSDPAGF